LYFHDERGTKAKTKQIIISVKSGENVTVSQLRDLRGVIDREDAEIGVLISMAKPPRGGGAKYKDNPAHRTGLNITTTPPTGGGANHYLSNDIIMNSI